MIEKTFTFLPGIGVKKEKAIYRQGIRNWNSFLQTQKIKRISKERKILMNKELEKIKEGLYKDNLSYLTKVLPQKENYKLYDFFKDEAVFLDIEVDSNRSITVIGLFDGFGTNFLVKGVNLYRDILKKELGKYKLIITFNGSSFDLPLIEKQFNIPITQIHIDLKHLCKKAGLTGSLKEIEVKLNLKRPSHLYGHPVEAWRTAHASQDDRYIRAMLNYNEEDLVNLKPILDYCYKRLSAQ